MQLRNNQQLVFTFFISLFIFDVLILYVLESLFVNAFAYVPYYRLATLLFSFVFLLPFFIIYSKKIKIRKVSNEDYIVILWCLFSLFELFYGFIVRNPLTYLIADFVYIIFGGYLYLMFSNISFNNINEKILFKLAKWMLLIFIFLYYFNNSFSENYYFILLSLVYVFLLKKNYWLSLVLIIPFLIQIKNSNRALLICFGATLFFYLIYSVSKYLKKEDSKFVILFILFFLVFFNQELLGLLFEIIPESSVLHFRIKQVLDIYNNGIDFNNPQHVSIAQRIIEAKVVVNLWFQNIFSFLFGCGLGAVIDGSFFVDASVTKNALMGSKSIHNIHLLPFALIHKYGFLGVFIFLMLVIDVLNSFKNVLRKNEHLVFVFWNLVFILIVVYSMPAASFLWASPLFWVSMAMKRKLLYE